MDEEKILQKDPLLQYLCLGAVIVCCVLAAGFGFAALSGKQITYALVSQIEPTRVVMVYDTAFSLCVASIGLLALIFLRSNIITRIAAVILFVMSILTFWQHIFHIEWDITRTILFPYLHLDPIYGGKMLPLSSFCFLLTALALFYIVQKVKHPEGSFIFASTQGIILLSLGILFLFGYVIHFDRQLVQSATLLAPMPANDSLGFIFLGIAIIATVIYLKEKRVYEFNNTFPIFIAAIISVIGLLSWRFLITKTQLQHFIASLNWVTAARELFITLLFGTVIYFYLAVRSANNYSQRLLAMTRASFEAIAEGILVVDNNGKMVDFNQQFLQMWKITLSDAPGDISKSDISKKIFSSILNQLLSENKDEVFKKLSEMKQHPDKFFKNDMQLKDQRIFEVYSRPQYIGKRSIGQVYSFHDITNIKRAKEQLFYQATHDILTGLANRALLFDRVDNIIQHASRHENLFAIFFVDLDRFKLINDSLGHNIGDSLLKAVAKRLEDCTRSSDTLARLGGDEFVLLALNIAIAKDATVVAQKYVNVFAEPFYIANHELYVNCSIGISLYPQDGDTATLLLKNADVAMYLAKKTQQRYQFYEEHMHTHAVNRLMLSNELRRAIENDEFILYYQPIINVHTRSICATEALIRWNHPQHGQLQPSEFISVAEETGDIITIGEWVLRNACLQNKSWQQQGLLTAPISVNISTKQLQQLDFFQKIINILQQTALQPEYLEFELTEGRLIHHTDAMSHLLYQLKHIGITIAIDDFGTGYSGFGYFKHLPLDRVKIDQSFIKDLQFDTHEKALVTGLIALCRNLQIRTVAEGVEAIEQYQILYENGCDEMQGYLFTPPLPAMEYEQFVQSWS